MRTTTRSPRPAIAGFTLVELLVVIAVVGIMAAMAVPLLTNAADRMKLRTETRNVERELQQARLKAVSSNRPMRVRFNCPGSGQYRMVELIGTPSTPDDADSASDRCSSTRYPYPPPDLNPLTRPNLDGPLRQLDSRVSFGTVATIQFWPDGSAHADAGGALPWPPIGSTGQTIQLVKGTETASITVNGLGKVRME